jgi:hypothetical protein
MIGFAKLTSFVDPDIIATQPHLNFLPADTMTANPLHQLHYLRSCCFIPLDIPLRDSQRRMSCQHLHITQ